MKILSNIYLLFLSFPLLLNCNAQSNLTEENPSSIVKKMNINSEEELIMALESNGIFDRYYGLTEKYQVYEGELDYNYISGPKANEINDQFVNGLNDKINKKLIYTWHQNVDGDTFEFLNKTNPMKVILGRTPRGHLYISIVLDITGEYVGGNLNSFALKGKQFFDPEYSRNPPYPFPIVYTGNTILFLKDFINFVNQTNEALSE